MVKAADLRGVFGTVTHDKPLFLHKDEHKNIPVKGINVEVVKWTEKICAKCNNERTQPYDKAWDKLSAYLRTNVRRGVRAVNLKEVFGDNYPDAMLDVHLYFVKFFGFCILTSGVDIDIRFFQRALLERCPHPDFYLGFSYIPDWDKLKAISMTNLYAKSDKYGVVGASIDYAVEIVNIELRYWLPIDRRPIWLDETYHPNSPRRRLPVREISSNQ